MTVSAVQAAYCVAVGQPKTKATTRLMLEAAVDAVDLPQFMQDHNSFRERWIDGARVWCCECGADLGVESNVLLAPLARAHEAHQAAALRELLTTR